MRDIEQEEEASPAGGGWLSFVKTEVSLGNILIMLGMVGTGAIGIYTVGGSVQRLQDAIEQQAVALRTEAELRTRGEADWKQAIANVEREQAATVANLQRQEAADVGSINRSLGDMKNDLRIILQASVPANRRP